MEAAPGVHRLGTKLVNFYAIEEGGKLTLIDAGLPGYWRHLVRFLNTTGKALSDIEAVVLTHAHIDHIGFSQRIHSTEGTPVRVHVADAPFATGEQRFPAGWGPVWRPMLFRYLVHGAMSNAITFPAVSEVVSFEEGTLDLPGRPRVIHTPGHTKGSCALVSNRTLFAGDALATMDITTGKPGPRIGPGFINDNSEQALASLSKLEGLDVDTILVGHGEPWTDGADEAVHHARQVGIW
ncbi:MAG: MBL fold metallo-hydrolase [Acidimicrobiia bacterium]